MTLKKKTKKKPRERIFKDGKYYTKRGVQLTRNLETETESEHMSKIRSAIRNASKFWKPALKALEKAHRPYTGNSKRIKHEYMCAMCKKWYQRSHVEINHIEPCGSLKCYEDVPAFLYNLFCEDVGGYNILCGVCHLQTTKEQKERSK